MPAQRTIWLCQVCLRAHNTNAEASNCEKSCLTRAQTVMKKAATRMTVKASSKEK